MKLANFSVFQDRVIVPKKINIYYIIEETHTELYQQSYSIIFFLLKISPSLSIDISKMCFSADSHQMEYIL